MQRVNVGTSRLISLLGVLGTVLLLGGVGHSAGVLHLYLTSGVPEANRIVIDVWVAQAHLLGGGLYVAAFRAARRDKAWRSLAIFGALTVIGFCVTMLPVLFARGPVPFRIPPVVYLLCSVWVLAGVPSAPSAEPSQTEKARAQSTVPMGSERTPHGR